MITMVLDDTKYTGADRRWLYYPGDPEYAVNDFTINLSCEECSTVTFTIYPEHPWFSPALDPIEPRKSMITVYRNGEILFYGQVRDIEVKLDGSKIVYAVSELAFLLDTIQSPRGFHAIDYLYIMIDLITKHNAMVSVDRRFDVGPTSGPGDNEALLSVDVLVDYDRTLDVIRDQMSTYTIHDQSVGEIVYKQYITVTHTEPETDFNKKYITLFNFYNSPYIETINQEIYIKKNVLDMSVKRSGEEFYTAMIPVGATTGAQVDDGIDARVNISTVNGGKIYIQDNAAVAKYGFVCGVAEFGEIRQPANLLKQGRRALNRHLRVSREVEVSVFDLSLVDDQYDAFDVGKKVVVHSTIDGNEMAQDTFGIVAMQISPLDPSKNTITLTDGILRN